MSLHDFLQEDPACRRLAEGAVHCVAPLLEDPDPELALDQLEEWSLELAARMPLPWDLDEAVERLNLFLFHEIGLEGDRATYDDPRNAVLPEVMRRRRGMPIALSILWIDQARRLGFEAAGVGLPGHFITALQLPGGLRFFDPFHGGSEVDEPQAEALVRGATRGRVPFHTALMAPTSDRAVLSRLVRNLHLRFFRANDWDEALWTATHLLLLEPGDPQTLKERAVVHLKRGEADRALQDLEAALHLSGGADEELAQWMDQLRRG